jgi:hypothetical protein
MWHRIATPAVLVHLSEATVGGCAWGQTKLASIDREIGLRRWQVECVYHGDRQPGARAPRRKRVGALKIGRTVSGWRRQG